MRIFPNQRPRALSAIVAAAAAVAVASFFALNPLDASAEPNANAQSTRYEAEDSPAVCEGTIESNHSGYSGTGFCDTPNTTGTAAQFTVTAASAGEATVAIGFANGSSGGARGANVVINGATVTSTSFEVTGSWSTWSIKTLTVPLNAGDNTVRLVATGSGGLPNIDYLDLALPDDGGGTGGDPVRYEAEDAPAVCDGSIDSSHAGYSGTGFCNTPNRSGTYVEFTVYAGGPGTFTLGVKFANGSSGDRPADVRVNGAVVQSGVPFRAIGSWSSWAVETVSVPVREGGNTIRLTATGSGGLANIDYLDVVRAGGSVLPSSLQWSSSGPLVFPKSDSTHNIVSVKDPSVVYHNGRYHVFVSVVNTNQSYSLAYLNFTDWSQAGSAPLHFLDRTAIGGGYKAAPQVFYFAPQQRWYLIYQIGNNVAYSTTTDIANPSSWSAPTPFYTSTPQIVLDNRGSGQWLDFWILCDSANCHMYSSDDNGNLYRAQTSLARFPNGFSDPVIAMHDPNHHWLFEGVNVYKLAGANEYLLMVEAITAGGRMFRSWTSPSITGPWTPLADTKENPFASRNNVTFDGSAWTNDISHGELIRAGSDQTLTISPCDLQFLYQGKDPNASGPYNLLPWRLGLLTQTNSPC